LLGFIVREHTFERVYRHSAQAQVSIPLNQHCCERASWQRRQAVFAICADVPAEEFEESLPRGDA
jgi:hypothetical protein